MSLRDRNLIGGVVIAMVLAVVATVPSVRGISTWKYVAGMIGLWLFLRGGFAPKN
jgi:hypothetical protein